MGYSGCVSSGPKNVCLLRVIFFKEVPVHRPLQLVIDHGSPVVEAKGWREKTATPQVCWWIKVHEGVAKDSFFAAYDMAVFSSARSMTEKEQKEILRQSILGSGDATSITLPEQMVLGIYQFASLYDEVDPEQVDDKNAPSATSETDSTNTLRNNSDKMLKECFFPQKNKWRKACNLCKQGRWYHQGYIGRQKSLQSCQCLGRYNLEGCQGSCEKWKKGTFMRQRCRKRI